MDESKETVRPITVQETCEAAIAGKIKPSIAFLEQVIGTPYELEIIPDGTVRYKHEGETGRDNTKQPRRLEALIEALAAVEQTIVKDLLKVPPVLAVSLPTVRDALRTVIGSRDTVGSDDFKEDCFALRAQIEETKVQTMLVFQEHPVFQGPEAYGPGQFAEMLANLKLSFRHLEDARMRLGKAIQAYDGGESCYPR